MVSTEALMSQAHAAFENAKYDEAKRLCREGIRQLEKSKDKRSVKAMIEFLKILSDSEDLQGRWFDSINSLERIIKLADEQRDLNTKAETMIQIGYRFSKSGKWKKAQARFEEAEQLVNNFENPYLLGLALGGLGEIYFRVGRITDAISNGQKMLEIAEEINDYYLIGKAANLIANGWYTLGEFGQALEANQKTVDAHRRADNNQKLAMVLNNRGEIFKAMEDYEKALDSYNEGLKIMDKDISAHELTYYYPNMAECYARLGNVRNAKAMITKAEQVTAKSEDKYAVAYFWMIKGVVEHLSGNDKAALDLMKRAGNRMNSLNVPYDTGIIALEYGKTLIECDYKGEGMIALERALGFFDEAGSNYMAAKVKKLIADYS